MKLISIKQRLIYILLTRKSCVYLLLWWFGRLMHNKGKRPCPNWVYFTVHTVLRRINQEILEEVRIASPQTEILTHDLFNAKQQCPFQHIVGLGGRWDVRLFKLWRVSKVCRMESIQKRSLIVMFEACGGEYVTELSTNHVIILLHFNKRSHLSLGWLDTPD